MADIIIHYSYLLLSCLIYKLVFIYHQYFLDKILKFLKQTSLLQEMNLYHKILFLVYQFLVCLYLSKLLLLFTLTKKQSLNFEEELQRYLIYSLFFLRKYLVYDHLFLNFLNSLHLKYCSHRYFIHYFLLNYFY